MSSPKRFFTCLSFLLSFISLQGFAGYWPNEAKIAINLSYHDGLASQLDNAVPMLEKHQLKASFYPTLSYTIFQKRFDEWKALGEMGHEFGNHSIHHSCSKSLDNRDWVKEQRNLDKYSIGRIRDELEMANFVLHIMDGESRRTFDPPCNDLMTAEGNYLNKVKDLFYSVQGYENRGNLSFRTWSVNEHNFDQIKQAINKAISDGTNVLTIVFHGVGAEHLKISNENHKKLLAHLAGNPQIYWVNSYRNIIEFVDKKISNSSQQK